MARKDLGSLGSALQEAGFAPNQLQGAYAQSDLLELYAKLARELRRLPTANDLRLQDTRNPDFPNQKVFERIGSKPELVTLLQNHCQQRGDYEDVIAYCESYSPRQTNRKEVARGDDIIEGTVYLLKSGRFYKIGRSNSAGRREYEIALQMPERATTVHVIKTDDPVGIETYWHSRFAAKRKNGEWFDLDLADVTAFKRRKFM